MRVIESAFLLIKELMNFAIKGGVLIKGAFKYYFIIACDGKGGFGLLRLNAVILCLMASFIIIEALIVFFMYCAYERNIIVIVFIIISAAIVIIN